MMQLIIIDKLELLEKKFQYLEFSLFFLIRNF